MTDKERAGRRIAKKRQRARKRGATIFEAIDNLEVYKRFNYHCCNCGIHTPLELKGKCLPNSPEMDHIIPLCKGGQHVWSNIQLLCRKCNIEKGDSAPPGYKYIKEHKPRVYNYRPRKAILIPEPVPHQWSIAEIIDINKLINKMLHKPNNILRDI